MKSAKSVAQIRIAKSAARPESARFLVLGIGNRLRGDDAIGSIVAEQLARRGRIPAIDCGEVPDNHVGRIWELAPADVVIVDACDFGGRPGEVRVFAEAELERIAGAPLSTHQIPLPMLIGLIRMKEGIARRVRLVGVQPAKIDYFSEGLTEPAREAIPRVKAVIRRLVQGKR